MPSALASSRTAFIGRSPTARAAFKSRSACSVFVILRLSLQILAATAPHPSLNSVAWQSGLDRRRLTAFLAIQQE
jgi:hypothetical protein